MPSALELAIARFRQAVLAEEMAATRTLIAAYQPARERLIKRIDELVDAMQAAGSLTPTQITKFERAVALAQQVEDEVTRLSRIANQTITDTQGRMVAMAGDHAQGLALAAVPDASAASARIDATWNRINPDAVEVLAGRMSDGSPLGQWLSQFGPEASQRIAASLAEAVTLGTNPRAVAARLTGVVDIAQYRLLNTARTTILDSYRSATLASYSANSDLGSEWEWISAKDSRVCLSCLALDGRRFPITTTFQPCHNSCRCSSLFVLDGVEMPDRELASDWFARQPESVQREKLPKSAYDDFKEGRLTLRDFSTLHRDDRWGDRYRQSTVQQARANASRRQRRAA